MGNSADDRKTGQAIARMFSKAGRRIDEDEAQALHDTAADIAHADQMPLPTAIALVGGLTRLPYGTPRKKI